MIYERTLAQTIKQVSKTFRVLLVTGPRQVGKTTLLENCAEMGRKYVTLDDYNIRQLAQEDPNLFIQTYKPPLIIDEIQYAPQLFSYIKIMVDREKQNGMYWLTGSQKFELMEGIAESLAGRVAILDLLGLSQAELENRAFSSKPFLPTTSWFDKARKNDTQNLSVDQIYSRIWLGSFPQIHSIEGIDREIFYRSYVQTYIQRDVRAILKVSDENTFYKFIVAVAARTGQVLNFADLARDVAIDQKTAKSWMSALEASGLVFLLRPFYSNITKRLITSRPKLYFLDTGLCSFLTKWTDAGSLEAGAMSGAILETYILGEILKSYWHNGKNPSIYYYRDKDGNEIDLIIEEAGTLYPLEFKKTAMPSLRSIKHFNILKELDLKVGMGAIICFVENAMPLAKDVYAIPVGLVT